MNSEIIGEGNEKILNVFDMINERLSKIEENQYIFKEYFIYQERRKKYINGSIFGWKFNVKYNENRYDFPQSDAILIELPEIFDRIKDLEKNVCSGKYDYIFNKLQIDKTKIKLLATEEDQLTNYKHKNLKIINIISVSLYNEYLKNYDITIRSYDPDEEYCFVTSLTTLKYLYIDEFINPIMNAIRYFNDHFDIEELTIYNTSKECLIAFLIITKDIENAKKLWNNCNATQKKYIRRDSSKDYYFKDYNFDFDNFSYTLKKHY